jgi:putative transcriptional regulator
VVRSRLKELREAKGLTQAELGRRVKVDPSLIRRVEAGQQHPYPRLRREVARVLGVRAEEVFPTAGR